MPLINFLNQVLPGEGLKCWVEITKQKKVIQGFVTNTAELASKLLEIDARGSDAYFACASFMNADSRAARNALAAKAFWLDIDCGEGKPYATADDALQACEQFCDRCGIDFPGVIRSGTGIHCYWVTDQILNPDQWLHIAQRFKLLTAAYGFHCDPSRTADLASILRPPGTKNYKLPDQPRAVILEDLEHFEPVSWEELSSAIIKNLDAVPVTEVKKPLTPPTTNQNLLAGVKVAKAFDATTGVAAGARGSTQLKYAGELVAKGFEFDEVVEKCKAWNQLCTPPQEDKEVVRIVRSAFTMHAHKHPAPPLPPAAVELPALPSGFKWGSAHELLVRIIEKGEDGKPIESWKIVSQLPVYLAGWLNDEGHETRNSYLFHSYHPIKGWRNVIMNPKEFNGMDWYSSWSSKGGSIMEGADKYFKMYVRRAENMLRIPGNETKRYNQLGWKEDDRAFLVGENLCWDDGRVERAHGTDKLEPLMRHIKPAKSGSLAGWSSAANKFGTIGMEGHLFMLLCGFAAPLMKFCVDEGNGGSILSVISEQSGHGKTPMASAIASIWGEQEGIVTTGNFTENRRIEDLVRHCHLVQVQEEMAYSDPALAALGVEKFTSGTNRGRLSQSGASLGIPERYQTILVSLSNKSLYDLVRMVNIPMSRRVFEIEIARPGTEALSNLGGVSREMMANHGHAGLQFARIIVIPEVREYIRSQLSGDNMGTVGPTQLKYRAMINSRPEHRFMVWMLSAVDITARILTNYNILYFDVDRVMTWAVSHAVDRVNELPDDNAVSKLNAFLNEHADECLTVPGPYTPEKGMLIPTRTPIKRLNIRYEYRNNRLFINHDCLQRWCTKNNISFRGMGKQLKELKVLLESSRPTSLGAGTQVASGRSLCWEIDMGHPMISGMLRLEVREEVKVANLAPVVAR